MDDSDEPPSRNIRLTSLDDEGIMSRHISTYDYENSTTCQTQHNNCMDIVYSTTQQNTFKRMMDGMRSLGFDVNFLSKSIKCEPCVSGIYGAYDTERKDIVMCENNLPQASERSGISADKLYSKVIQENMIYAYDAARNTDPLKLRNLACSYVRAVNLPNVHNVCGGELSDDVRKECVTEIAVSMLRGRNVAESEARRLVQMVIYPCSADFAPYPKMPS